MFPKKRISYLNNRFQQRISPAHTSSLNWNRWIIRGKEGIICRRGIEPRPSIDDKMRRFVARQAGWWRGSAGAKVVAGIGGCIASIYIRMVLMGLRSWPEFKEESRAAARGCEGLMQDSQRRRKEKSNRTSQFHYAVGKSLQIWLLRVLQFWE
jgi:hypothetical protein